MRTASRVVSLPSPSTSPECGTRTPCAADRDAVASSMRITRNTRRTVNRLGPQAPEHAAAFGARVDEARLQRIDGDRRHERIRKMSHRRPRDGAIVADEYAASGGSGVQRGGTQRIGDERKDQWIRET